MQTLQNWNGTKRGKNFVGEIKRSCTIYTLHQVIEVVV